jgi:ABC-type nitrate/sulfonate/bicarbonate transport system permease component
MTTTRIRFPDFGSLVVLLGVLGIWEITAWSGLVSPVFLPPIEKAAAALVELAGDGTLLRAILGTTFRMLLGFTFATLVGCGLGILIGLSPRVRAYIEPSLEFLRPLPASAIIPVAILMLGLTKTMIIFVIAFGSLWPTLLATIQGIKSVEPRLFEMAETMELSQHDVIRTIVLPSALPDIFAGLRLGLTVSLILAVVTEMMSAEPGLGSIILHAARSFNSSDLFAGVIVLGALGFTINAVMEQVQNRLMRWQMDG